MPHIPIPALERRAALCPVPHHAEEADVLSHRELVEENIVLRTDSERGAHLVHLSADVEAVDESRAGGGGEQACEGTHRGES